MATTVRVPRIVIEPFEIEIKDQDVKVEKITLRNLVIPEVTAEVVSSVSNSPGSA